MTKSTDVWVIHKKGAGGVISPLPYCGYDDRMVKVLRAAGYRVYLNGKLIPAHAGKIKEDKKC